MRAIYGCTISRLYDHPVGAGEQFRLVAVVDPVLVHFQYRYLLSLSVGQRNLRRVISE